MTKLKLIEVYVEKKYLWPLRIATIIVSLPFVLNVYQTLVSSVANDGVYTFVKGEHWGYYAYLSKHLTISALFLWLGLFGIKEKR
jgi:hypothetical protein